MEYLIRSNINSNSNNNKTKQKNAGGPALSDEKYDDGTIDEFAF